MSDQIDLTFKCSHCGATPAALELPDNATDDDIARCKSCGSEIGRFGDVKAQALYEARREFIDKITNAIKRRKS